MTSAEIVSVHVVRQGTMYENSRSCESAFVWIMIRTTIFRENCYDFAMGDLYIKLKITIL
jgi:hypothetical protein